MIGSRVLVWTAGLVTLVLALSQGFVIYDACHGLHTDWGVRCAVMATGFEGAILVNTLTILLVGMSLPLLASEAFLIVVSVMAGMTFTGTWSFLNDMTLELVPLQYACLVMAGHAVHKHTNGEGKQREETVATALGMALVDRLRVTPALSDDIPNDFQVDEPMSSLPEPDDTAMTPTQIEQARTYVTLAGRLGDRSWSAIAKEVGKSERTIKRWRSLAERSGMISA